MMERHLSTGRFARQVEFGEADSAGAHLYRTTDRAHLLFEHADHIDIIITILAIALGDGDSSTNGRVSRKRQFS